MTLKGDVFPTVQPPHVCAPMYASELLATFTEGESDLLASSEVLEVVSTEINSL